MKYGFIGAGNMAFRFIKGMLNRDAFNCDDIYIYEKNAERSTEVCKLLNVNALSSPEEITESCGVVFIAVKPDIMQGLLTQLSEAVKKHNPLLVSMAAGKTIEFMESFLPSTAKLIRIMPNINAEISQGITSYCANKNVLESDKEELLKCLNAVGTTTELNESLFDIFMSIASCAPAFVYMFIDAMAAGAVKYGLNKKTAVEIAAQTVLGSSAMLLATQKSPQELTDMVTSPGGATIEGLCALMENGFQNSVVSAISAAYNKAKGL